MGKNDRAARNRQSNDIIDRVLVWFGLALIIELFLLAVNRYYFNYRVSEIEFAYALDQVILPALTYVGLFGLIGGLVWAVAGRRGKNILLPTAVAVFSAAVSGVSFLSRQFGSASVQAVQVMVPVMAVLALVYHLYQKEFFTITLLSGLSIFGLWLYRRAGDNHATICFAYLAVTVVILAAAAVLTRLIQREDGLLTLGSGQYRVFPRNAVYAMIYITCALSVLTIAATLALGATAAYCAIFVLVAWIFVMAAYYTVRLM